MYTACRLAEHTDLIVMSTILDEKQDNVAESSLSWMRSLLMSTDHCVGYVPTVTVYHVNGRCDSVYCSVSW